MALLFKKKFGYVLLSAFSITVLSAHTVPIIIPRSQSVNAARELVGWQQFINQADRQCLYGVFSLTTEYQQSFNGAQLMRCLFDGDVVLRKNNTAFLEIQGSRVAGRTSNAWLADYFGLPTDFSSVVTFKPVIQNGICDFNAYIGLDRWTPGFFFRIHAPLVWARWNLCASEDIISQGSLGFDMGYMNHNGVPNQNLRSSFLNATNGTYTWRDMETPLAYGIFPGNKKTLVSLSDVELAMGYNFLNCENYHFGLELRGSIPEGNRPCGVCLFEPIVGNGQYWTLGGGSNYSRCIVEKQ